MPQSLVTTLFEHEKEELFGSFRSDIEIVTIVQLTSTY